ncbi:MAG: hypothetical protein IJQ56_05670 [Synergistaceae bacterium]|nr:hypothetical protein [Synergistaceae bacterium]
MKLGNWELDNNMKTANLPQKAQSAFTAVTSGLIGCDYQPVLYVGSQLVNGTNHCILAIQRPVVQNPEARLVKMIVHEDLNGSPSLMSISGVAL